uniref:Uncharacterized protein n=1 Tax=viral metagenome TaxID=1070528 RepID=A0A6M3JQ92_9ZZZZ
MLKITREIARSIGRDAANRNMKKGGRTEWNEDDWNVGAEACAKVWPEEREEK